MGQVKEGAIRVMKFA